jgi:hypothetical protein
VSSGNQAKIQAIRDVLTRLDQDWSNAERRAQQLGNAPLPQSAGAGSLVHMGGPQPAQMSIDQAVVYYQRSMPNEVTIYNMWKQFIRDRRALLGQLPELASFLQRLDAADAQQNWVLDETLRLERQQLTTAQSAQQAFHANNAYVWNSLAMQMSGIVGQFNSLLAKKDAVGAETNQVLNEIRSFLQSELDSLSSSVKTRDAAQKLIQQYAMSGQHPNCSEFARALVTALGYPSLASGVLSGQVVDQVKAMKGHPEDFEWLNQTTDGTELVSTFLRAQAGANQGKLVFIAWQNPNATSDNTGHIAIVVPSDSLFSAGKLTLKGNPGWGMNVPYVAQGGDTLGIVPLSQGFDPDKAKRMVIFELRSNPGSDR